MPWRTRIVLTAVVPAKSIKEKASPEARIRTAAIIAPMPDHPPQKNAGAGTPVASESIRSMAASAPLCFPPPEP